MQHKWNNSTIGKHFSDSEHAQYLANLQNQFSLLNVIHLASGNVPSPIENLVFNNFSIVHLTKSTNYNSLAILLEALLIKYNNPLLKRRLSTVMPISGHSGNTSALMYMSYCFQVDMKI